MLTTLIGLTFLSTLVVSAAAVALFWKPLTGILRTSLSEGAASLWSRGIGLGVLVVGISVGTRIWDLERYATAGIAVSSDQLVLEVYKSVIATAQRAPRLMWSSSSPAAGCGPGGWRGSPSP